MGKMKKVAVLLFDLFSNYELSVALSVLAQGGKEFDVFCARETAASEEGLAVKRSKALGDARAEEYDALLIPGCMDPREIIGDEAVLGFLRQFDLKTHVIASISSTPLLLLRAGLLEGKRYMAGVMKEELLEEGFTLEEMAGMTDVTGLERKDGRAKVCMEDGNLITAVGSGFIEFGIAFGKKLGLDFEPAWYGQDWK